MLKHMKSIMFIKLGGESILIIQMNRYNVSGNKIKTTVWPNDIIKLQGDEFMLCAIGHHLGQYFTAGHYLASVKAINEWTQYNDTNVSQSSETDAKSMESYICIYSKVFTLNTSPYEWQKFKSDILGHYAHI